jgi:hypothetical protein
MHAFPIVLCDHSMPLVNGLLAQIDESFAAANNPNA